MKLFIVLLTATMLTGCAPRLSWYNPAKPYEERQRDYAECQYEAEKFGYVPYGNNSFVNGYESATRQRGLYDKCLTLRGYRKYPNDEIDRYEAGGMVIK